MEDKKKIKAVSSYKRKRSKYRLIRKRKTWKVKIIKGEDEPLFEDLFKPRLLLHDFKDYYQKIQSIETVEIVKKPLGINELLEFNLNDNEGRSFALFWLIYKKGTEVAFPMNLIAVENSYKIRNIEHLMKRIEIILDERVSLMRKYY